MHPVPLRAHSARLGTDSECGGGNKENSSRNRGGSRRSSRQEAGSGDQFWRPTFRRSKSCDTCVSMCEKLLYLVEE